MGETPVDASTKIHARWERVAKKHKMYKEKSVDVFPIEEYKVGNALTIQAIPLEFYRGDVLDKHGESIKQAIQNSDGVIFEYFPQEIEKIRQNPLIQSVTNVEWFMPYYQFAAKAAIDSGKNAYVMDPAHDLTFAFVRGASPFVYLVGGVGSYLLAGQMDKIGRKFNLNPKTIKGLTAASFVSMLTFGITAGISMRAQRREHKRQSPDMGLSEPNFRRVLVAKGIRNLSQSLEQSGSQTHKKIVLLYPPVHWKGIKHYLDNPQKLDRAFKIASAFKVGGLKDSLFMMRSYVSNKAGWDFAGKTEII